MTTTTTRPSIDITVVQATAEAVAADRDLGKFGLTLLSRSTGGLTAEMETGPLLQGGTIDESRRGRFTFSSDEPLSLLGTDTAASPSEYILQALAGCYTVSLSVLAAKKGIQLDAVRLSLDFDIDVAGFLGIDPAVRNGAQKINVDIEIDSPGTPREQLEELVNGLASISPIHDTLANPVPISARLS